MSYPAIALPSAQQATEQEPRAVETVVSSVFVRTLTSVLLIAAVAGFGSAVSAIGSIA